MLRGVMWIHYSQSLTERSLQVILTGSHAPKKTGRGVKNTYLTGGKREVEIKWLYDVMGGRNRNHFVGFIVN